MPVNISRTWLFLSFLQRGSAAELLMESSVACVDSSVRPGSLTFYLCDLEHNTIPEAHDFHPLDGDNSAGFKGYCENLER